MDIIIKENYEEMSKCAAGIIAAHVRRTPAWSSWFTGATAGWHLYELIRMHRKKG